MYSSNAPVEFCQTTVKAIIIVIIIIIILRELFCSISDTVGLVTVGPLCP